MGEFGSRFLAGDATLPPEVPVELQPSHSGHESTLVQGVDDSGDEPLEKEDQNHRDSQGGAHTGSMEEREGGGESQERDRESQGEEGEHEEAGGGGSGDGSGDDESETEKGSVVSSSTAEESQSSRHSSSGPKGAPNLGLSSTHPPPLPQSSLPSSPHSPSPIEHGTLIPITRARARHTSAATTITTEFSDMHGATEGVKDEDPLPPTALESSITTGTTEEEMRRMGLRLRAGLWLLRV